MKALRESYRAVLAGLSDEYLDGDLLATGIAHVSDAGKIVLSYPYPGRTAAARATLAVREACRAQGLAEPAIESRTVIASRIVHGGVERIAGVRNIIAVASAKGGVGKSAVAANLALGLACEGASVGLLDADIYGPSMPVMMGGAEPVADDKNRIVPLLRHGIKVLSIGHLIAPEQAVVWRAPMAVRALDQLFRGTAWGELDFLVLDMPPGTGDIQLSVAQKAPVTGAVLVTTPQDLALADAVRGLNMFVKVSIPVLGFVENMTQFVCPECGSVQRIFGTGAGATLTAKHGLVKMLEVPLDPRLRAEADSGMPTVAADPDCDLALGFRQLAARVGAALVARATDRSLVFPKIVVSND